MLIRWFLFFIVFLHYGLFMDFLTTSNRTTMKLDYTLPAFNPNDIDIRLQYISVLQLEKMIESGKLYLPEEDELRRMSNTWNDKERSSFIESIMANLPIQLIYLDGSKTPWTIIDGLQRIISLHNFFNDKFALSKLEYFNNECEGMYFSDIPFYLKSRIESTNIIAYVVNPGTPDVVKFNIFKRVNKTGRQRNREELREAFYQNSLTGYIKDLADSEEFLQATHNLVKINGLSDRELVSRYFAFRLLYPFFERTENMDDFIDKGMSALAALYEQNFEKEILCFKRTMQRCYCLLKDITFININSSKRRINNNLFDVFSYVIADLSDYEYLNLLNKAVLFNERYRLLFKENNFLCTSKLKQNSKKAVYHRFNNMKKFINQFIYTS